MAWMFAAVQDDMTVGMHLHIHYLYAPPFPPTPFYPHPAIGMLSDNFARKTRIDNKKAARTGTKSNVIMPPHLPYIGPFTHGMPKDKTGVQVAWMGAGMGAHPFGGVGFVVIEGKPAAGFLSGMLGCWCVAPGFDMKVPLLGLDFIMVPGFRFPTVLYGPAPLALDLFVLLLSMIEDLLDYLVAKIPIPWLRKVAEIARDAFMTGLEVAVETWEENDPHPSLAECLARGARFMGYAFADGMVTWALDKALGKTFDRLGSTKAVGWLKQSRIGGLATDIAIETGKDFLRFEANKLFRAGADAWTGGEYGEYYRRKLETRPDFGIGSFLVAGARGWGVHANTNARNKLAANYKAHLMNRSITARGAAGGRPGADEYRAFNRGVLRDSKAPGWKRRDDAFERHFNKYGPGGMTGFGGVQANTGTHARNWSYDGKPELLEGARKGGKTVLQKAKEKTMADMFNEATKDLFGGEDELGQAGEDARKTFAKTLARRLFKL